MRDLDRTILRLAVPALGSLAIEPLYVLVDTAIVGHLGTGPLGGLAIATTVLNVAFFAFNFLAYAVTPRVAFLTGRGEHRSAAGIAVQGLWLAVGIGVVVACALLGGAGLIARVLGARGTVLTAAVTYLRIAAFGVPLVLVTLVGNGYLRGVADTRTPLKVVAVANVLNVVLELWLVYGLRWGVAGSALGTLVAQALAAAWFLWLIARRVRAAGASLVPVGADLRLLVSSGHQLLVRTGALLGTLTLATSVAARAGASTLAAHQIAIQMFTFLALALDALAIAAQTLVGTALGRSSARDAREIGTRVLVLSVWVGVGLGVALAALSVPLPHVFTSSDAVVRRAVVALVLCGALQVPGAAVFALDGILMGASDFKFLKWGTLSGLVAFAPFGIAVVLRPSLGIAGVWCGLGAWMVARLAVNGTRFRGTRWLALASSA